MKSIKFYFCGWLIAAFALLASAGALAATTYTFTGGTYSSTSGPYVTATPQYVSGSFTVPAPLPANLSSVEISAQITSYLFSDGVNSYSSSNPDSRIYGFILSTDSNGAIISGSEEIVIEVWLDGTNPHSTANHFNWVSIYAGNSGAGDFDICSAGVGSGPAGVPDTCTDSSPDLADGYATSNTEGTWSRQTASTSIPTLSEWGMIMLAILLALGAVFTLRRQRQ